MYSNLSFIHVGENTSYFTKANKTNTRQLGKVKIKKATDTDNNIAVIPDSTEDSVSEDWVASRLFLCAFTRATTMPVFSDMSPTNGMAEYMKKNTLLNKSQYYRT